MSDEQNAGGGPSEGESPDESTMGDLSSASPMVPAGSEKTMLGDRYEIGELLGQGGMAEVHEAYDLRLGRRVAVKILRPELARDPSFHQRFRREAHSAAALNHPNIVAVYDTGEGTLGSGPTAVTVPYIVMEYVDGMTLRQLIHSGRRLLPERALDIISQTLAALDYSHRHGIVHRDIKPANIMITKSGDVKVMDFGIARALAASGQTMTAASQVMGTAQYLSPEQAKGEVVDARSDLYSTGCVLYELLTDRAPFMGETPVAVAYQHVSEQPIPPSELDSQVTPDVDAIVLRALAKNPDDRYQTAAAFKTDVDNAISGAPVTAPIPVVSDPNPTQAMPPVVPEPVEEEKKKRSGWIWVALIAAILLLLGGAFAFGDGLFGSNRADDIEVPNVKNQNLQQAQSSLEGAGLRVGQLSTKTSNKAEGTVLQQDPAAGEMLEEGQGVDLTVSGGPGEAIVPNVVGTASPDAARKQLELADLELGNVRESDSDQPEGYVLSQSPDQGTSVAKGTAINIVVSNGQVTVPGVTGKSEQEARTELSNQGLRVSVEADTEPTTQPAGSVSRQSPDAGTKVSKGDTVTIYISPGPTPTTSSQNQQNPDRQGQSAPPQNLSPPEAEGDFQP